METRYSISVILPCYNGESFLKECLNSINRQLCSLELVFVNDGSTDNSFKIFKDFLFNDNVTVVCINRENKGFLHSLDEAINLSTGNLIARIDADDYWFDNHLVNILERFDIDENLVLIGSQCKFIDANSKITGKSRFPINHKDIVKHLHKDNPFIHSSVVFKKNEYNSTKGYNIGHIESLQHIADYNLWFELSKLGKCENMNLPSVYYRLLDNSMSRSINKKNNYLTRYQLMSKVNSYYKKHIFYSMFERLKVKVRILQHTLYGFRK
jgi:glycosyltransferase involved in cell wall biosynthesis